MAHPPWNESYLSGEPPPWDTGVPEPLLVEFVEAGGVRTGRALDVGAGTGTNALWLAERGFEVLGVDVATAAVEQARQKLGARPLRCRFEALDFLASAPPGGPYDFVFDRGCFHVFDAPEERARFAARVAAALGPGGQWLSLIGSTEGAPRDVGPPRRSARDVVSALEPELELVELRSAELTDAAVKAWFCLSRRREQPAQPSTR